MNGLPLHPAIVHVPLGVAVVIPLLAAAFAWAIWKGKLPHKAWLAVLVAQAIVVGSAVLALRTGEADEDRVEDRVGEAKIEEHEERAQAFTWTAAAVLLAAAGAYAARSARGRSALMAGSAAGSVAVLALGLSVGHAGGEMVHGPATANAAGPEAAEEGATGETAEAAEGGATGQAAEAAEARSDGAGRAGERGEREEHEERDDDD